MNRKMWAVLLALGLFLTIAGCGQNDEFDNTAEISTTIQKQTTSDLNDSKDVSVSEATQISAEVDLATDLAATEGAPTEAPTQPQTMVSQIDTQAPEQSSSSAVPETSAATEKVLASGLDTLLELARSIYNSHSYVYDPSWDSTKYSYYIAETKKGACLFVSESGELGSEVWIYDANGNLVVDSNGYVGPSLAYDGTYYEVFDNTSGDETRYVSLYYPEEHHYSEDFTYNENGEKVILGWTLDGADISEEEFEAVYERYFNNEIPMYDYQDGFAYYYHAGTCETFDLRS